MNTAIELSRIADRFLRTNTAHKKCIEQFAADSVRTYIFEDKSYMKVDENSYDILATGSKYY
jgi:hypothetical protein